MLSVVPLSRHVGLHCLKLNTCSVLKIVDCGSILALHQLSIVFVVVGIITLTRALFCESLAVLLV